MKIPEQFEPLMENILRLCGDAALLRDNDRNASACVLAVIALEEVGKLALLLWKENGFEAKSKRENYHKSKQSAALALVFSSEIADEIGSLVDHGREEDESAVCALAERVSRSPAAKRLAAAERGMIDRAKKTGLYHDGMDDHVERARFSTSDVNEMLKQAADALKALQSKKALILGRVVYDAVKGKL